MKLVLLALWAALIPGTFLLLDRIPTGCSLASSLVLVGIAWLQARKEATGEAAREYALRIALGMSFGFGGDVLMGGGVLLGAMAVFAAGHFFYLRAMLGRARREGAGGLLLRSVLWFLALGAGFLIWHRLVLNGTGRAAFMPVIVYGGLFYTLFLASMTGVALGLASRRLAFAGLGLGGALFLASDAVIAARVFSPEVFQALPGGIRDHVVWLTYAPAQLLIVASAGRWRKS